MAEKAETFENVCHFEGDQVLKREFRISKLDDMYRRTETASKPANQGFFVLLFFFKVCMIFISSLRSRHD